MRGVRRKCARGFRGSDNPRLNCGRPCSSFIGENKMICAFYYAVVADRQKNELCRAKVYSFEEGYWNLDKFRDMFPNGWYFTIENTED